MCEEQKYLQIEKLKGEHHADNLETKRSYELDLSTLDDVQHNYDGSYKVSEKVRETVENLSVEQLIQLVTGEFSASQSGDVQVEEQQTDESGNSEIGAAGIHVPGAAAETSACAKEEGIDSVVLADGPAGLRLIKVYYTDGEQPMAIPFDQAIENGFLCRNFVKPSGKKHYQYCTAFPVGTMLAQTWDTEMVEKVGDAVAEEMDIFNIKFWLAPGMNIHRNPLCGRNFEYYSEDPIVSGLTAAAIVRGVEAHNGKAVTIKHFACNNQEDNRTGSNSILSERALREIYLKGFEIAVRETQPMAVMTSYNLINGVHAAVNYDLCTKVLRDEWEFQGLVMTDWGTTNGDDNCTAAGCMRAGNDLVMPGVPMDHESIRKELEDGTLKLEDVKRSVARLITAIWTGKTEKMFESFEIKKTKIRNRIGVPPMVTTASDENGCATDFEMEHYSNLSKGGAGLIIQEATCVVPNGKLCDTQLGIWQEEQLPALKNLTQEVHKYGAAFVVQIHHAGSKSVGDSVDSPIDYRYSNAKKQILGCAMDLETADRIADAFVLAGKRAYEAGYDGVELHGAHGYLISELLDPNVNRRTDRLGEDAISYVRKIMNRIHEICGEDFIVGIRIGGMSPDWETARKNILGLKDVADYFSISWGNQRESEVTEQIKTEKFPYTETVYAAMKIKEMLIEDGCTTPVLAVGNITSPEIAEDILNKTGVDMVLVGRGHLMNPNWVNDTKNGIDPGQCRNCRVCQWKNGKCPGEILLKKERGYFESK